MSSEDSRCPLTPSSAGDTDTPGVIYYGVWQPPSSCTDARNDHEGVFTDKKEALLVVKNNREARFKTFLSYKEACQFSKQTPMQFLTSYGKEKFPLVLQTVGNISETSSIGQAATIEKGSAFHAPKSQELVKLRKAIQAGDVTFVKQTIWANPRYLVSSGDSPTILHEGSRLNALHVASNSKQPTTCLLILETIEDPNFMQLLYNDDSEDTRIQRINNLVDLYLNMPEKGLCETPLHFAAKFGCLEIVRTLVSHPACDKQLKNKYQQTAKDVICSRCRSPDKDLKLQIEQLFEEHYFIPVLASEGNTSPPYVGDPWSPAKKNDLSPCHPADGLCPLQPSVVVRSYAGPMSYQQAKQMHQKWKRPSFNKCSTPSSGHARLLAIRLSDADKGLERIGRELAKELNVPWAEKWPFLDSYCNLSKGEGLSKLEMHLRNMYNELSLKAVLLNVTEIGSDSDMRKTSKDFSVFGKCESDNEAHKANVCSPLGGLCDFFRSLNLSLSGNSDRSSSSGMQQDSSPCLNRKNDKHQESFYKVNHAPSTPPPLQELTTKRILDQVCADIANKMARRLHECIAAEGKGNLLDFVEHLEPGIECLIRVARHHIDINKAETSLDRLHFAIAQLVQNNLEDDYVITKGHGSFQNWLDSSGSGCLMSSSPDDSDDVGNGVPHWRDFPRANASMTDIVLQHVRCILKNVKTSMENEPESPDSSRICCCCNWKPNWNDENCVAVTCESQKRRRFWNGVSASLDDKDHCHPMNSKPENGEDSLAGDERWPCTDLEAAAWSDDSASEDLFFTPPNSFPSSQGSSLADIHTPDEGIPVFISGSQPTKLDLDVMRALEGIEVDPAMYPHIHRWQLLTSTYSKDEIERWATPSSRGHPLSWQSPGSFDWTQSPLSQRCFGSFKPLAKQAGDCSPLLRGEHDSHRQRGSPCPSRRSLGSNYSSPCQNGLRRQIF